MTHHHYCESLTLPLVHIPSLQTRILINSNKIKFQGGADHGDEYFAELDYIEVVERLKEGYESDIQIGEESDEYEPDDVPGNDSDDDFRTSCRTENLKAIQTRLSTRNRSRYGDSDSNPEEVIETKKKTSAVDENGDSITISDDEDGKIGFFFFNFFDNIFFY